MKAIAFGIVAILLMFASTAAAQPLVTEALSVYYDFDEVTNFGMTVPDRSGNGLDGEILEGAAQDSHFDGEPDIVLDTENFVRGTGSIWFNTDVAQRDDFIAIGGCTTALGCDAPTELVPSTAVTIAAWMNVTPLDQPGSGALDMSIYQPRSEIGSFTHTQLQGNGQFRMQFRGQAQAMNIIDARLYTDGSTDNPDASYPRGEWFHWAGTYNSDTDEWAMFYNGEEIGRGLTNTVAEPLGDWGQGAYLGLVPDLNRQFVGKMDEFYLFTRALSADEIGTLALLGGGEGVAGDFNGSGQVEQADLDLVLLNWGGAVAGLPATWTNERPTEGIIDQAELDRVLLNWGNTAALGNASVPEPGNWALVIVAIVCGWRGRRLAGR